MNILIVDDDEIARLSLASIAGAIPGVAEVVQAQDGEEAWELLQDGLRPALCCCDLAMPRLDGLGLLQRVRQHPVLAALPLVLISSAADRDTVQSAIASGVAGYILKPFLAAQTRSTLERLLRQRRQAVAEQVQATRRRLAVGTDQLQRLLAKMRGDTEQCLALLEDAAADAPQRAAALQRLHGGALVLGLWRCAELLKAAQEPQAADDTRLLLVREVLRLVHDQVRELGPQAASPAPA